MITNIGSLDPVVELVWEGLFLSHLINSIIVLTFSVDNMFDTRSWERAAEDSVTCCM